MPAGDPPVADAVSAAYAAEWGRIVAGLIRHTGDWDLAEECTQDAFAKALERWPRDGVPDRPGAWLTTTARHAALDRLRRAATETRKLRELAGMLRGGAGTGGGAGPGAGQVPGADVTATGAGDGDGDGGFGSGLFPDDRLQLIFTCCHPALPLRPGWP